MTATDDAGGVPPAAEVDTLIQARWVVPVVPEGEVLTDSVVAVANGTIREILPAADATERYPQAESVELDRHAVIPGLINAHTHTAMTLLRGLADDLPLMEWLNEHIWPAEGRWVSTQFVRDGAELAMAEMLRGGTTCFNDMYFFPDAVAAVADKLGMRACVGLIVIDMPTPWARDIDEYLRKAQTVHDEWRDHPLITTAFAPHSPYAVNGDALKRLRIMADEMDIPIHTHVHETAQEIEDSVAQHGLRPLARLHELGLVHPSLIAVHMTQLTHEEIATCAESGLHVVHCPESNQKLASGFCRVEELRRAGVPVALGTDGAASNNDLDMFGEMRSCALLAKGVAGDPAAAPAPAVLSMATLNGARALGIDEVSGSLEPGKSADLVAVDLGRREALPVYNVISQLVYATNRDQVTDVWVAGRRVVSDGGVRGIDDQDLCAKARQWGEAIARGDREAVAAMHDEGTG